MVHSEQRTNACIVDTSSMSQVRCSRCAGLNVCCVGLMLGHKTKNLVLDVE